MDPDPELLSRAASLSSADSAAALSAGGEAYEYESYYAPAPADRLSLSIPTSKLPLDDLAAVASSPGIPIASARSCDNFHTVVNQPSLAPALDERSDPQHMSLQSVAWTGGQSAHTRAGGSQSQRLLSTGRSGSIYSVDPCEEKSNWRADSPSARAMSASAASSLSSDESLRTYSGRTASGLASELRTPSERSLSGASRRATSAGRTATLGRSISQTYSCTASGCTSSLGSAQPASPSASDGDDLEDGCTTAQASVRTCNYSERNAEGGYGPRTASIYDDERRTSSGACDSERCLASMRSDGSCDAASYYTADYTADADVSGGEQGATATAVLSERSRVISEMPPLGSRSRPCGDLYSAYDDSGCEFVSLSIRRAVGVHPTRSA